METACSRDTLRDGGRLNPPMICAAVAVSVGETGVLLQMNKGCYFGLWSEVRTTKHNVKIFFLFKMKQN